MHRRGERHDSSLLLDEHSDTKQQTVPDTNCNLTTTYEALDHLGCCFSEENTDGMLKLFLQDIALNRENSRNETPETPLDVTSSQKSVDTTSKSNMYPQCRNEELFHTQTYFNLQRFAEPHGSTADWQTEQAFTHDQAYFTGKGRSSVETDASAFLEPQLQAQDVLLTYCKTLIEKPEEQPSTKVSTPFRTTTLPCSTTTFSVSCKINNMKLFFCIGVE